METLRAVSATILGLFLIVAMGALVAKGDIVRAVTPTSDMTMPAGLDDKVHQMDLTALFSGVGVLVFGLAVIVLSIVISRRNSHPS